MSSGESTTSGVQAMSDRLWTRLAKSALSRRRSIKLVASRLSESCSASTQMVRWLSLPSMVAIGMPAAAVNWSPLICVAEPRARTASGTACTAVLESDGHGQLKAFAKGSVGDRWLAGAAKEFLD